MENYRLEIEVLPKCFVPSSKYAIVGEDRDGVIILEKIEFLGYTSKGKSIDRIEHGRKVDLRA